MAHMAHGTLLHSISRCQFCTLSTMASRTGMLPLNENDRLALIRNLKEEERISSFGTGCLVCNEDDDHANLLLCEGCNDEYHTYCLDPPLRSVPNGDWYCPSCKIPSFENDGLDELISALPPSYTSRFGEVCWAHGGASFGWWPSLVYDPRLTVGSARQLAKKNLGKRHLVYFFECHDAPYTVLPDSKIQRWIDGLTDDLHLGKTARSAGKARIQLFQQALQAATLEAGKSVEMRMDWNHQNENEVTPKIATPKQRGKRRRKRARDEAQRGKRLVLPQAKPRGFEFLDVAGTSQQFRSSNTKNLNTAIQRMVASRYANEDECTLDKDLCCKIFQKSMMQGIDESTNIGFVKLISRKTCSFVDARKAIENELVPDFIPENIKWKFFLPTLGPVSNIQEETLGSLLPILQNSKIYDSADADGSMQNPFAVYICSVCNS